MAYQQAHYMFAAMQDAETKKPQTNPLLKLALEVGPLALFFFANAKLGIFWATAAFMVAITVSVIATWLLERRVPKLPLVTGVFVLIFGGLTLILQDELFIKLKPTIVNSLFAVILLGGLAFGRSFLKSMLGTMFQMTDKGWRILTVRWALFFVALAIANEIVWRNYSTDAWVSFKVFAIMPATIIFSISQLPTMNRHHLPDEAAE